MNKLIILYLEHKVIKDILKEGKMIFQRKEKILDVSPTPVTFL